MKEAAVYNLTDQRTNQQTDPQRNEQPLHRPPNPNPMGNKPITTLDPAQATYTDHQIPPRWDISP